MSTIERKLAYFVTIDELNPIKDADRIERASVKGWDVVVKKGEFNVGDLAVYLEVDSFVPTELAPFLTPAGKHPKEFNGVQGERLKTKRLKGVLSQGLLLPLSVMTHEGIGSGYYIYGINNETVIVNKEEGADCTVVLGIQKWEKPLPAQLAGQVKGNFPTHLVPRTDQDRIQNVAGKVLNHIKNGHDIWAVQEKLDGSSCTMLIDDTGEFVVCSRNLALKRSEENAFWKEGMQFENAITALWVNEGKHLAFQGELIAQNIQGNPYKMNVGEQEFRLFDIYDIEKKTYLSEPEVIEIANRIGMKTVPTLFKFSADLEPDITPRGLSDLLLEHADGVSVLAKVDREGLVFKSIKDPNISFKAISNKWLLSEKD
jgi:RNA ligase (TIGR02306 family)